MKTINFFVTLVVLVLLNLTSGLTIRVARQVENHPEEVPENEIIVDEPIEHVRVPRQVDFPPEELPEKISVPPEYPRVARQVNHPPEIPEEKENDQYIKKLLFDL
ncbi:uncharacterized protein LOC103577660 isoform X1 [Microplitis demolitor]|uniref:uncharacterized protein LOC103577660 isoform X1 n=1 Tax=Microplitis demolitor TaxID=69319 RepID=UPI0004CD9B67|nr:uncharacterized protein LOC103577660 isoform X1 [Microplitis demolitor]